jgi:hypothetical protein
MNNKDDGSLAASILIADAIRTQDQQRLREQNRQELSRQQAEHQEELDKIAKENKKRLAKAESDAEMNEMLIHQWKIKHDDVMSAFLNRAYQNIYHQSNLYGTRFLLLDLAEELNIPKNILIKISLLSTENYMKEHKEIPTDLSNYFNNYSELIKEKHYDFLLDKETWKLAYENRIYKTMRDARGEIAKYLLSNIEIPKVITKLLNKLDSRFDNLEETKKMLTEILAEQKIEQDKKDQEEATKQAQIKKEQEEKDALLLRKKTEEDILSSNIVIKQGEPLDKSISEKNYNWIYILKHILNSESKLINLKVDNEGTFFSPNKKAIVQFIVPFKEGEPLFFYHFYLKHLIENTEVNDWTFQENKHHTFSLGKMPVGTKIEKLDFIIKTSKENEEGKLITKPHIVTYYLKKPFIVG